MTLIWNTGMQEQISHHSKKYIQFYKLGEGGGSMMCLMFKN